MAERVPMPDWVRDEVQWPPRLKVLVDAVKDCTAEEAVVPSWQLKYQLGIYSPTPQYRPGFSVKKVEEHNRPAWAKKRLKRFYDKNMQKIMERDGGIKLRYLPNPRDRLTLAGTPLLGVGGAFTGEKEMWEHLRRMSSDDLLKAASDQSAIRLGLNSQSHIHPWSTGYQRAAIRMFPDLLKRCDVVAEIRDARIPWISAHPDLPKWCRPKPRVIVLTKCDLVPPQALKETIRSLNSSAEDRGCPVIPVNALEQDGGAEDLRRELLKAGAHVNRRRLRKGINPRGVRVMMAGFPNVGKSAIINQLAGRRVCGRSKEAGETKGIYWHRIGGFRNTELEFLDMPGVIPENFEKRYSDEEAAMLSICRCIGERLNDREKAAHDLLFHLGRLKKETPWLMESCVFPEMNRLYAVDMEAAIRHEGPYANEHYNVGNLEGYCGKIIKDFNDGKWGRIQLEAPPLSKEQENIFKTTLDREAQRAAGRKVTDIKLASKPFALLPAGRPIIGMPALPKKRQKVPIIATRKGYGDDKLFDGW